MCCGYGRTCSEYAEDKYLETFADKKSNIQKISGRRTQIMSFENSHNKLETY